MLLLCPTGLPLIFHHEIGHPLGTEVEGAGGDAGRHAARRHGLKVVAVAQALHPGKVVAVRLGGRSMTTRSGTSRLGETPTDEASKTVVVDAHVPCARLPKFGRGLHVRDVAARRPVRRPPGTLSSASWARCSSPSSPAAPYAPFMRKLESLAGAARPPTRVKWLDLHNMCSGTVTPDLGIRGRRHRRRQQSGPSSSSRLAVRPDVADDGVHHGPAAAVAVRFAGAVGAGLRRR